MASGSKPAFQASGNSLTFLRFVLAGLVVYDHATYLGNFGDEAFGRWSHGQVTSGQFAVEAFFVLSGVLITQSFIRIGNTAVYFWHRLLRIAPAYWVCLIWCGFLLPWVVPNAAAITARFYLGGNGAGAYVVHNFLIPASRPTIAGLFTHSPISEYVNGSIWSLKYEFGYYVMVAAIGLLGFFRRPWLTWGATGLLYVALVLLWLPRHDFPGNMETGRGIFSSEGKRLGLYYLMGTSWALLPKSAAKATGSPWCQLFLWLGLAGATAIGWYHPIAPLMLPPLILGLGSLLPLSRWEKWVGGDYSYGIYIYSYPLLQTLIAFGLPRSGLVPFLGLAFVLAIAAAALSWHWIERPALAWKDRLKAPRLRPA